MQLFKHTTKISNVLVIGCGGAGLRAAIEVKKLVMTSEKKLPKDFPK